MTKTKLLRVLKYAMDGRAYGSGAYYHEAKTLKPEIVKILYHAGYYERFVVSGVDYSKRAI